jgi:DHA2 family metal-tetracycline-proton antiporter-like MFS transporter
LSSAIGIFAEDFYMLLVIRILQSLGAGVMSGLGLVIVSRYVPAERRGRSLTMISTGSAMAFGLGPIIGGVITQYFGFNGLFAFTCLILALMPVMLKMLPKEAPVPGSFDIRGALLTMVNASSLLVAVSLKSWLWLVIFLVSLLLHYLHMRRGKELFIRPELFKVPGIGKLMAAGFLAVMVNMGNLFLMPLVLADLFGKSPMVIGFFIAPGAILSAFLARLMGFWIDRFGSLRVLPVTLGIVAGVLVLFAATVPMAPLVILFGYLLFAPCFTATLSSLNKESSLILPKPLIGAGMGLLQMVQFFGGALSAPVSSMIVEWLKEPSLAHAYQGAYGCLMAAAIICLAILTWYRMSLPGEENSNKPEKA